MLGTAIATSIVTSSIEYHLISTHYGNRFTVRSDVHLMQHIDHGIAILQFRKASEVAQRAFCIHPMLQSDEAFELHHVSVKDMVDARTYSLAVEYRRIANAALSDRRLTCCDEIELSDDPDVNEMLVADKVQNRNDFLRYHEGRHPRSAKLARYFELWLQRLGVTRMHYSHLINMLDSAMPHF